MSAVCIRLSVDLRHCGNVFKAMDNEKLINLVFERRPLWDRKCTKYYNRDIHRKSWIEISKELNTTFKSAKTRWRTLRDSFRKELVKIGDGQTDLPGEELQKSSWPFFQNMLFIKDQFIPRNTRNNLQYFADNYSEYEDTKGETSFNEDNLKSQTMDTLECMTTHTAYGSMAAIKNESSSNEDNMSKRDYSETKHNSDKATEDSDYYFLMSLLPYLKNLPAHRKMAVRTKIQQIFCDEEALAFQFPQFKLTPSTLSPHSLHSSFSAQTQTTSISDFHQDVNINTQNNSTFQSPA